MPVPSWLCFSLDSKNFDEYAGELTLKSHFLKEENRGVKRRPEFLKTRSILRILRDKLYNRRCKYPVNICKDVYARTYLKNINVESCLSHPSNGLRQTLLMWEIVSNGDVE